MFATRSVDYSVLVITRQSVDQMLWIKKAVLMFIIVTTEGIIGGEREGGSLTQQLSVPESGCN